MRKIYLFIALSLTILSGCKKDGFDVNKPDVETFVQMLKTGTYSQYETNEKGEKLWLKRPAFKQEHVAKLIDLSNDTSHIKYFPSNPISSRTPIPEGRDYFILGECLLWLVEGVRSGGSLDPYLIDTSKDVYQRYKGVAATEILAISEKYRQWWNTYKHSNWKENAPLANTTYRWM